MSECFCSSWMFQTKSVNKRRLLCLKDVSLPVEAMMLRSLKTVTSTYFFNKIQKRVIMLIFQDVVLLCRWSDWLIRLIKFVPLSGRWQQDRMRQRRSSVSTLPARRRPLWSFCRKRFFSFDCNLINQFFHQILTQCFCLWALKDFGVSAVKIFCLISYKSDCVSAEVCFKDLF